MIVLVQYWQLKIIPPVLALSVIMGYSIYYAPHNLASLLIRGITQMIYTAVLFYFEEKIKWSMVWVNLQQEKWMQVNDFILNNIPENIMILDLDGGVKFLSDYCKSFLEKCHIFSLDTKILYQKIQDLTEQQSTTPSSPSFINDQGQGGERHSTGNVLIEPKEPSQNMKDLDELIFHFKSIINDGLLREKQFLIYNGKLKIEDHPDRSVELKLSYIKQTDKEYIILIIRDTTQRDMLVTLSTTNKYKDQLLASVSHELRAPLNGNINLVESAINSGKVPEAIKENLLIPALRSSQFLLHLINDILDMSQIKEKKLRLVFQNGDLRETLKNTALLVELQAKKKEIELQIELDPGLPKKFCTDHIRLSQIVLNLLNNAIKFTQNGVVKLTASLAKEDTSWVKISVQDSGIGMSQGEVQKLFSDYTHIEFEGRQVMNPSGVGLGLKIASNLADLLSPEGQPGISVESNPGQGSTFTFIIEDKEISPLELDIETEKSKASHNLSEADDEVVEIQPPSSMKMTTSCFIPTVALVGGSSDSEPLLEGCSCPRILIVDDNPFNTMAFETILGSLEIRCESVYNGSSAIKKLMSCQAKKCGEDCQMYSIVFMDQEMPGMTGAETVREILKLQKEDQIPNRVKIIGCTAHRSGEEVDKFIEAGLEKCIHKPISAAMIKSIL